MCKIQNSYTINIDSEICTYLGTTMKVVLSLHRCVYGIAYKYLTPNRKIVESIGNAYKWLNTI